MRKNCSVVVIMNQLGNTWYVGASVGVLVLCLLLIAEQNAHQICQTQECWQTVRCCNTMVRNCSLRGQYISYLFLLDLHKYSVDDYRWSPGRLFIKLNVPFTGLIHFDVIIVICHKIGQRYYLPPCRAPPDPSLGLVEGGGLCTRWITFPSTSYSDSFLSSWRTRPQ